MSPWSDCPIVEVRSDPDVDLYATIPPFRGDREAAAVASTLAGLLAFAEAAGRSVWLGGGPGVTEDQDDLVRAAASMYYRHHKARRGVACKKCGTLT